MKAAKPIPILLAEDDPDDRYLISEALDESQVGVQLFIVDDGEDLLDYLNRRGKFMNLERWPLPRLILLDLNMPRLDGREALKIIKESPEFRRIPVVVLTTSNAEEDIHRTYDLGISGYITKPSSFSGLLDVIKAIGWYWLQVSELPNE